MMENNIEIKIAHTDKEVEDMKNVRREVFVKEQSIPEALEFDGNDPNASHVLAYLNGKPVGTMRIRYFNNFVKFERMSVIKEFRAKNATNIADLIMNKGIEFVAKKGYRLVYGVCKKELLPRWMKCGYKPIKNAPSLEQNGMTLIPIMMRLKKHPEAIKINDHPSVLTAQEDSWQEAKEKVSKENATFRIDNKIMSLFMRLHKNLKR